MVEMSCCKKDQFLKRDFQPYLGISLFLQLDHGKNDFSALSLFFSWAKVSSSKMNNFFTVKNIQISETGELNGSENNTTLQGLLTDGSFRTSSISYKKYTLLLPQEWNYGGSSEGGIRQNSVNFIKWPLLLNGRPSSSRVVFSGYSSFVALWKELFCPSYPGGRQGTEIRSSPAIHIV